MSNRIVDIGSGRLS